MSTSRHMHAAMQFNCPHCGVAIGQYCISTKRMPMAHFVHPYRLPKKLSGMHETLLLRTWLKENMRLFLELK